jgi:mycothiol synthase
METKIMTGLRLRPYAGESDLTDIARIENGEAAADALPERTSVEHLAARFSHPNEAFDPRRDVTLAELDGIVAGVAQRAWVDTNDGLREYRVDGAVDPAYRRRGLGTALLAENERLSRELAAGHDTGRQRVLGSWSGDSQPADSALMASAGFSPVRWFFEMTCPSVDDAPDLALPDGLIVRPITPDLIRPVWRADVEAFRDHWGGFDDSDEQLQRWLSMPATDVSLWVVAFDGDEVAGGSINFIDAAENEALGIKRGWVGSVFTRRPWRKRGLASALVARSLMLFRERGMTSAGLGVDADNPSGALAIYERLGFEVSYRSTAWRKPL